MNENKIYQENIFEIKSNIENEKLYSFIQLISLSLDNIHEIDFPQNDEKIKNIYYNSYFIIINSIKLYNTEFWYDLNEPLKKAAESLEILSKLENNPQINNEELLFDSILIYSITNYYSRAYVLTKNNLNLELPKYKEVIFQFMNRNLEDLRNNLFALLNSDECNEKKLIKKLKESEISKFEALEYMLSYSIFKSLNEVLNYIYTGKHEFIENSLKLLERYGFIALNYGLSEFSWLIEILKIMIEEFYTNSLWNQLKPLNNEDSFNPQLKQYILNYAALKKPVLELWPSQLKAMPQIIKGNNFTVKMPTSAGKTLVAELSILKFLIDTDFSRKIIYLSPFKSLSTELEIKFKKSLGKLGVNVSEFYGNYDFDPFGRKIIDYYDLFILTPEKFDSLLRTQNNFKENIGLIIIDEGHIIGENNKRGLKFELLITRVKRIFENSRFIFISGVLPNMEEFTEWLTNNKSNYIESNWKPSDVLIGTLTWNKKKSFIRYFNGEIKKPLKFMTNIYDEKYSSIFPKDRNEVLALSALKFSSEGQTFIFSPEKKHINSVANAICSISDKLSGEYSDLKLKIDEKDEDIKKLKEIIIMELGLQDELLKYLNYGFLIHHGSLPENIKFLIEDILRKNKIKLVIGTDTLAQGINFPIKTVLIKSIYRYGKPIDNQTIQNIIGRSGRANESNNGRVLLVIDKIINKNSNHHYKFKKLVNDDKRLESSLHIILQKFKSEFNNSELNFEEFCLKIAEKTSDEYLNEQISSLDLELFSFIEENKDLADSELLELIIKYSLYHAQFPDHSDELKILLKSRIQYLKNQYSQNNRSQMYKLGFNLQCCEIIEEEYEYLNEVFNSFENWDALKNKEKRNLLYEIAIFFFETNIFQAHMFKERSFKYFNEKIIEYWINGLNIYEISEKTQIETRIISSLIKSFKNTLPWLITNTMIFLEDQNRKYKFPPLDPICEYIPSMFQYGVFNLKRAMILYEYNDLKLCDKIYEYMDTDENSTFLEIYTEIMELKMDFPFEIAETKTSLIRNYSDQYNLPDKITIKIKKIYLKDINLHENDFIIIKKENEGLIIFNINGSLLKQIDETYFEFSDYCPKEIQINNIWTIKSNGEYYILEKI